MVSLIIPSHILPVTITPSPYQYYANTGALKKASENRKPILEDVLRLEYRSKLINPHWRRHA